MTKEEYKEIFKKLTDEELFEHCKVYIWLSQPIWDTVPLEYLYARDAAYEEAQRRCKIDLFDNAYEEVMKVL